MIFYFLRQWLGTKHDYHYDFHLAKNRCRILVIDDDPQALPLSELKKAGYNIEQIEEVDPDSMRLCEEGTYDVILLDYMGVAPATITPDDGFGVFDRIRSANPAQYIIAISAKTYDIAKTKYFKNANDWLKKPTDLVTTKDKIDQAINTCFDREFIIRQIDSALREKGVSERNRLVISKQLRETRSMKVDDLSRIITNVSKIAPLGIDVVSLIKRLVRIKEM